MKRFSTKTLIFLTTFGIGLCIFVGWNLYDFNKIAKVIAPIIFSEECEKRHSFPGISEEISKTVKKSENGYFPKNAFGGNWEDASISSSYGTKLEAMNETSLLDITERELEVYRFTWLRIFDHPISVRIENLKDRIKIVYKELDRSSSSVSGKLKEQKELTLKKEDWCNFIELLNEVEFWRMTPKTKSGRDGSYWLLEGKKDNRYHVVHKWSPKKGKYRELGIFMLKLSGFDFDKNKDDLY